MIKAIMRKTVVEAARPTGFSAFPLAFVKRIGWLRWCGLSPLLICLVGSSGRPQDQDTIERLKQEREQLAERYKWPEAASVAEKIVTLIRKSRGERTAETAEALSRFAWLANCAGDHIEAEKLWRETLAIQEGVFGTDSLEAARTLGSLGTLCTSKVADRTWEQLLQRSLRLFENQLGPDDPQVGKILDKLAWGYYHWGELDKAQSLQTRALSIAERAGDKAAPDAARSLICLSLISEQLSDFKTELSSLSKALAIREQFLGPDDTETAETMQQIAKVYTCVGDFRRAESIYNRSLAIQEKNCAQYERQKLFGILANLGEMYLAWGKLDKAEPLLVNAQEVLKTSGWAENRRSANVFGSLGKLYEARGDYQRAIGFLEKAAGLRESDLGPTDYALTEWLRDLARLDYALGRPEAALACADKIETGEERHLEEVLSFTSEVKRLQDQRAEALHGSFNLWATIGAAAPLARSILKTKGIVLDSLLEDRLLAEASRDPALHERAIQLEEARQRMSQLSSVILEGQKVAGNMLEAELQTLSRRVESLEAALARNVNGLGRPRRSLSIRTEQVQAAIPENGVLLEMLRYRRYLEKGNWTDDYGVLILSHSGSPQWVRLGPADGIDKSLKLYQHLVRESGEADSLAPLLHEIGERLWAPVKRELAAGTKQIIISPDSELNFLSFATLLTPSGRFLGEDYDVSYVSSGRDILVEGQSAHDTADLAVWANPEFGARVANDSCLAEPFVASRAASLRVFRDLSFHPLPGAEREGLFLRDHAIDLGFKQAVVHFGRAATEWELRRLHSPAVLHLATHGFVLPERESGVVGSDSGLEDARRGPRCDLINPMRRSGLALAGAQRTLEAWAKGEAIPPENDGIVTAEEISCLDLRGTRLVVLSACDTGIGEARSGEGVLGLRRAFVQAGAQNLLLTLWPIDDEKTTYLITDFYAAEQKSGNAAWALSHTQRRWLTRLRTDEGVAEACRVAGPFILSFRGR